MWSPLKRGLTAPRPELRAHSFPSNSCMHCMDFEEVHSYIIMLFFFCEREINTINPLNSWSLVGSNVKCLNNVCTARQTFQLHVFTRSYSGAMQRAMQHHGPQVRVITVWLDSLIERVGWVKGVRLCKVNLFFQCRMESLKICLFIVSLFMAAHSHSLLVFVKCGGWWGDKGGTMS